MTLEDWGIVSEILVLSLCFAVLAVICYRFVVFQVLEHEEYFREEAPGCEGFAEQLARIQPIKRNSEDGLKGLAIGSVARFQ